MQVKFLNNITIILQLSLKTEQKGDAIYELMKGIDFDIQTDMYTTGKEPKDTMWFRISITLLMK